MDTERRPGGAWSWVAAVIPMAFVMGALLVPIFASGAASASESLQEGGLGMFAVVLCAMVAALVVGVLLFLSARGRAIPGALGLFVTLWPWLTGLASSRWSFRQVLRAVSTASPDERATLVARGFAECSVLETFGALLSGALLAAFAVGTAFSARALARGARPSPFAALGLLGLVALAAMAVLAPHMSGWWVVLLPGLASLPALALGGSSLGRDVAARTAAPVVVSAVALALSFLVTGASCAVYSRVLLLRMMAVVEASGRLSVALTGLTESDGFGYAGLLGAAVALLASLVVLGVGARSAKVTAGPVARALGVVFVIACAAALYRAPEPDLGVSAPNDATTSTLLRADVGHASVESVDYLLSARGLTDASGAPLAGGLEPRSRGYEDDYASGVEALAACGELPRPSLRIGLSADAGREAFAALAERLRVGSNVAVYFVAADAQDRAAELAQVKRASPLLGLLVHQPMRQVGLSPPVSELTRCLGEQETRLTAVVGAEPADVVHGADGVERSLARRDATGGDDTRRELVELRLTPETTASALFETAAAIDAAGMRPVFGGLPALPVDEDTLTGSAPSAPSGTAARAVLSDGTGPHGRAAIAATMATLGSSLRRCFERELGREPNFTAQVRLEFAIQPDGRVTEVVARSDAPLTGHPDFAPCLERIVSRARFAPDDAGGVTRVRYPMVFRAAE